MTLLRVGRKRYDGSMMLRLLGGVEMLVGLLLIMLLALGADSNPDVMECLMLIAAFIASLGMAGAGGQHASGHVSAALRPLAVGGQSLVLLVGLAMAAGIGSHGGDMGAWGALAGLMIAGLALVALGGSGLMMWLSRRALTGAGR
jgi:hypothetical protein